MKTKTIFLSFFVALLSVSSAWADDPPCPGGGCPGGPVTTIPINENISLLVVIALILGIVLIYKNKIKKASV